jgi:two-component system alkaline phosphatase synthesis response regulator PhoP
MGMELLASPEMCIRVGKVEIHQDRRDALIEGRRIELTAGEFELLSLLLRNAGRVFARQEILRELHGDHFAITDRAVDVRILGLRKKLGVAAADLETVRGAGYRWREPQAPAPQSERAPS